MLTCPASDPFVPASGIDSISDDPNGLFGDGPGYLFDESPSRLSEHLYPTSAEQGQSLHGNQIANSLDYPIVPTQVISGSESLEVWRSGAAQQSPNTQTEELEHRPTTVPNDMLHQQSQHPSGRVSAAPSLYRCDVKDCNSSFTRESSLLRHGACKHGRASTISLCAESGCDYHSPRSDSAREHCRRNNHAGFWQVDIENDGTGSTTRPAGS